LRIRVASRSPQPNNLSVESIPAGSLRLATFEALLAERIAGALIAKLRREGGCTQSVGRTHTIDVADTGGTSLIIDLEEGHLFPHSVCVPIVGSISIERSN